METLHSRSVGGMPANLNGHMKSHEPQTAPLLKANIICGFTRILAATACLPCGSLF